MWSVIAMRLAGADVGAQRAGGVREHERSRRRRRAGRGPGCDGSAGGALVEVLRGPGGPRRARRRGRRARPAGVAGDRRPREAGQLVVADDLRVGDRVGDARRGPSRARCRRAASGRRGSTRALAASSATLIRGRASAPKPSGSSSPSVTVRRGPPGRPRCTGVSGRGELRQALAAAAARRADVQAFGDDRDLGDLRVAGRDHRADRRRLGALALRVGGVLDVRARRDAAVGRRAARRRPGSASRARGRGPSPRAAARRSSSAPSPRRRPRREAGRRSPAPRSRRRRSRAPRAGARRARPRARDPSRRRRRPRARRSAPRPSTSSRWMRTPSHSEQPAALVDDDDRAERRVERLAQRGGVRRPATIR